MEIVIALIVIAVLAGLFYWWYSSRGDDEPQRRKGTDPFSSADDDSVRGNPRTIVPGDLVTVRGQDYAVRGLLRLSEASYHWSEAFLDTGTGDRMWLSVEDDPDLEVVIWRELRNVTITPGPATLELDGRRYTSIESGDARFESEGTTGLAATGQMRYHDYEAGEARLSFEDFTGKWECARGELLHRAEYTIWAQGS